MRPPTSAVASQDDIEAAAAWMADNWHVMPQPFTRTLREQFGLGFVDAARVYAVAERTVKARERGNGN